MKMPPTRKILIWGAVAALLYIAYKLFFEKPDAGTRALQSGAGQVGQSDATVETFNPKPPANSTDNSNIPYGPALDDSKPQDGLYGPLLPDGSYTAPA